MPQMNGYIGRGPGDSAVTKARQVYNVTGATSTFTFNSGYDVGYFDVFINGVKLVLTTDYTAGNGTTFTLTVAAQNGDTIEAVAYKAFNLANINEFNNASGDFNVTDDLTVGGDVTVSGTITGDGSGLTNVTVAAGSSIVQGNTTAKVVDTGSDGIFVVETEGTERIRVEADGGVGIGTTASGDFALRIQNGGLVFDESNISIGVTHLIGDLNVSIGVDAGLGLTTGDSQNTIIGFHAGETSADTGPNLSNTYIGDNAGNTSQGTGNIALGVGAGIGHTNTNNSICIGANARLSGLCTDSILIGREMAFSNRQGIIAIGASANVRIFVDEDGHVGLGTTVPRGIIDFGPGSGNGTLSSIPSAYQAIFEAPQGTGNFTRNIGFAVKENQISAAINAVDEGGSEATGLIVATGTAGSIEERLRIDSGGNVGIGTDDPASILHTVKEGGTFGSLAAFSSQNGDVKLRIDDLSNTATERRLFITHNQSRSGGGFANDDATYGVANIKFDDGTIDLGTNTSGNTTTQSRILITASGNVGIGTDDPTEKLHVVGDARVTGILTVGTASVTIDGTNSRIGIESSSPRVAVDASQATDGIALPVGTQAQRPTGVEGYMRFNSESKALEIYNGTNWVEIISDYFPQGSVVLG